jgi:hypothetical protein
MIMTVNSDLCKLLQNISDEPADVQMLFSSVAEECLNIRRLGGNEREERSEQGRRVSGNQCVSG